MDFGGRSSGAEPTAPGALRVLCPSGAPPTRLQASVAGGEPPGQDATLGLARPLGFLQVWALGDRGPAGDCLLVLTWPRVPFWNCPSQTGIPSQALPSRPPLTRHPQRRCLLTPSPGV